LHAFIDDLNQFDLLIAVECFWLVHRNLLK